MPQFELLVQLPLLLVKTLLCVKLRLPLPLLVVKTLLCAKATPLPLPWMPQFELPTLRDEGSSELACHRNSGLRRELPTLRLTKRLGNAAPPRKCVGTRRPTLQLTKRLGNAAPPRKCVETRRPTLQLTKRLGNVAPPTKCVGTRRPTLQLTARRVTPPLPSLTLNTMQGRQWQNSMTMRVSIAFLPFAGSSVRSGTVQTYPRTTCFTLFVKKWSGKR